MKSLVSILAGIVAVLTFAFFALAAGVEFLLRGKASLSDIE